jgi:hypothetical protein
MNLWLVLFLVSLQAPVIDSGPYLRDKDVCTPAATHLLIAWTEEWSANSDVFETLPWAELEKKNRVASACSVMRTEGRLAGINEKEFGYLNRDLESRAEFLMRAITSEELTRTRLYLLRKGLSKDFEASEEGKGQRPWRPK